MRMTEFSDLCWRAPVDFSECAIESARAAKTRSVRDRIERQNSFVDQFLGKVQTARLDHRGRCGAQMLQKQTAQLTAADAKSRGESLDPFGFDAAFAD